MKVMIVSTNSMKIPYPVYPLGATTVAQVARLHGHETILVDLLAESGFSSYTPQQLHYHIQQFKPDCIGLSLRNLESTDSSNADECWSLDLVRQIVADVRLVSQVPIVVGGAGFSLMPEMVLKYSGADYGLVGEGEEIWPTFLEDLSAGRAEVGVYSKPQAPLKSGLGCHQISDYDPQLVRQYHDQGGLIGVQTKRGCPLRCLYCSYPVLEGRRIRVRPVDEVIDDLKLLQSMVGPSLHIAFADAVFNDQSGHWRKLLEAMVKSNLKVNWTAFFQPAEFEKNDLQLIKASGATGLEFGTDGSNDAALKGLNKPFNFDLVRRIQQQCVEAGVPAAHYLIFGGPGETDATVEEGLANLQQLTGCVAFISTGLSVYPGTPLFDLAKGEGLIKTADDIKRPVFYFSPDIDPVKLGLRLTQALAGQRDRLYPPGRAIERTEALRRMGYRGILWDTLIGTGERKQRVANG